MKQDLILIHGFRGSELGLKAVADSIPSKKYNIFLISIPPAGGHTLKEYSARHYAKFIADFIREKNLKKPVIVGHSMGSIVAAAVAERYPDLINNKLIFMSPISAKPAKPFAALTPLTVALPNKMIGFITTQYLFMPKDQKLKKQTLKAVYTCGADYTTKKDVFRSAKFSVSCCIADFEFKNKVLFISGAKDRLMPRAKTEKLAKKLGAKSIFLDNSGHLINYECPEKVATEIISFLEHQ